MSASPAIRRADAADLPAATATLAAAFADYAWTRWVVDPDDHPARLEGLYAIYLRVALELGQLWVSDDCAAVAAWTSSRAAAQQEELFEREGLVAEIARLSGSRIANVAAGVELLAAHAPSGEHWVLAAVGVRPERQGAGLGTRVLAPALAGFDRDGELAVLDTSSAANVRLYERLGFRVAAEVEMPSDGPRVWLMRREPRPAAGA
ncbi:GNAT family N-acetyltransferase [Conexibacter arvalis]|uniref:Ribosomal protein S18 acetylase RimI-like enzyme n=1 Tax=Conexibacter arvalis TaxID=912552 RepID=A0A840I9M4_9ACTN|nr:GNAT family N-acetyltransferase [Conexibacter arvalis]MBB4661292.1 ribosomal protein S18 acetylase RimI-like enzyme [Conexibacter arvalis]